ncbi:hypothetical protein M407DRAFT_27439 [Tulasnella calospora MUT 4182]|uniref:Uncharacterized protein n=1 Tax=Tulasnella calospora MUT 4182 TaxID=1051891 RepID=A0A0C3LNN9_9AGAM|nr:hypothetical protein M407DRAFT_27439 [Tulasnella calospora MUT 4182]
MPPKRSNTAPKPQPQPQKAARPPPAPPATTKQLVRAGSVGQPAEQQESIPTSGAVVPYSSKGRLPGPTTTRELVLWAKENGGELILARNLTGPEKLRIRAETLSGAVRAPFNLDQLFKLVESQLNRQ